LTALVETTADRLVLQGGQEPPYLTVVAASRNDDHGGGMTRRMQTFVNALVAQCDRHRLPTELILVDWNPPSERPGLADALDWPASAGYCSVRVIQVPPELHSRLAHADRLPFFQMIAKNVGIRRARAPFVLATNVDLVFPDALMRFLARRKLEPETVYRVDRLDISNGIDPSWPIERQLDYCRRSVIRVNGRNGTRDLQTGDFYRIYPRFSWTQRLPAMLSLPLLILQVMWRKAYAKLYWFLAAFNDPRQVPRRMRKYVWPLFSRLYRLLAVFNKPREVPRRLGRRLRLAITAPASTSTSVVVRPSESHFRTRLERLRQDMMIERARARLHTNASGDFTLMSKDAWLRSRGYLELEAFSMHLDGLQLFQARYTGTREKFIRHGIYHIEHDAGFKPEPNGGESWAARIDTAAIPRLSNEELSAYFIDMYRTRKPIDFNRDDWGLAHEELPERTVVLPRRLDTAPPSEGPSERVASHGSPGTDRAGDHDVTAAKDDHLQGQQPGIARVVRPRTGGLDR
jgi:hypothetical protein